MTKAYLVTSGQYSDYSVIAAFTTREFAEAFKLRYAQVAHGYGSDMNDVEEVPLDADPEPWVVTTVTMDRHGNTTNIRQCMMESGSPGDSPSMKFNYQPQGTSTWTFTDAWSFHIRTADTTRAIKVANERRTQLLALGQWEPKPKEPGNTSKVEP